jgi:hypothetical protein
MIHINIETTGATEAALAFKTAKPQIFDRWYSTMRKAAFRAVRIIQQRYRGASATSATATRQGTGALRGSYSQDTQKTTTGVDARIGLMHAGEQGHALRYGAVHEEGATIRSKGKKLTIPLASIRSPSGIAPPARSFPNTFVIPGRSRQGVIMQRLGGGNVRALFALRNEVRIPARPPGGAINAAVKEIQPELDAALEQDVVDVIAGSQGSA